MGVVGVAVAHAQAYFLCVCVCWGGEGNHALIIIFMSVRESKGSVSDVDTAPDDCSLPIAALPVL